MNFADIVFGLLLLLATMRGWRMGLLRSLTGLVGLLLAYLLSLSYGALAAGWILGQPAEAGDSALWIGFLSVFLATLVAVHIAGRVLQKVIGISPLGLFDALGGSAVGLAKGLLFLGVAALLLLSYPPHRDIPGIIRESTLGRPVQRGALLLLDAIRRVVPPAAAFYDQLGFRTRAASRPPMVDEIKRKARKTTARLDSLVETSRKRLESE
jgi:membrane protein required for colicin V production